MTAQLEALKAAGIGGVEITPIYGVRGAEDRFIPYLSDAWMKVLDYTLREAARLDLGVDMATGTGWPFGGPWVGDDSSPRTLVHKTWVLGGGERLSEPVRLRQAPLVRALGNQIHVVNEGAPGDPPRAGTAAQPVIRSDARAIQIADLADPVAANKNLQALALEQVKYPRDLPLIVLMAFDDAGEVLELTARVGADGILDWTAPAGTVDDFTRSLPDGTASSSSAPPPVAKATSSTISPATRFAATSRRSIAPLLDMLWRACARSSTTRTKSTMRQVRRTGHQRSSRSFRSGVDTTSAGTCHRSSETRAAKRRRQLNAPTSTPACLPTTARPSRISCSRRSPSSGRGGRARRGAQVRNQAHGAPANLLDLYAASDIPETEGAEIQRFKWATSAAHVAGRPLVSAEAATWLGEHFRSTLADVRANVDRFFVAGVNHIFYHGTAYSPVGEAWPGWQFYAAVEFSPQNSWWDDFGALNRYVTRVQSFLQAGTPDHDVLLYYPFYEALTARGNALLTHFGGASPPAQGTAFEEAAARLQRDGFTYDFISDRQILAARADGGRLLTSAGTPYRVLVLPAARYIPLPTFEHVLALARSGATVVSSGDWPSDIAGLQDLESGRARFRNAIAGIAFGPADADGIREAAVGRGRILRGDDVARLLVTRGHKARAPGRPRIAVRTACGLGWACLLPQQSWRAGDRRLGTARQHRAGDPAIRSDDRQKRSALRCVPRLMAARCISRSPSAVHCWLRQPTRRRASLSRVTGPPGTRCPSPGPGRCASPRAGPRLPASRSIARLLSWTTFGEDAANFSGTASYTATFARPPSGKGPWRLDLGQVRDSARVHLNGRELATLIGPSYQIVLDDAQVQAKNVLAISVSNLAANRIRDLDRRGVAWKKFYNVNFPARLPENRGPDGLFTAAGWDPLDSGLLGPVTLTPLSAIR